MRSVLRLVLYTSLQITSLIALSSSSSAQSSLHTLIANGSQDRRINIVIVAEAYTLPQKQQFLSDAGKILSTLMSTSPWSEYQSYVNGYALFVASNQSGADDPSASIARDTYFNSTYDSYGTGRLLTIPPNDINPNYADGYGKVYNLLASQIPSYDIALILINDLQYGGSGGTFPITSLNSAASEIAIHELGHSHARLGDEYSSTYPGYPDIEEPNTTKQTDRNLIKWRQWISAALPIPTPALKLYGINVGLFEGAHYHATGWYRPQLDCKMRSLDADFCPVCTQAHVLAHYALVSPLDSFAPMTSSVSLAGVGSQTFYVNPMQPSSHSVQVQWYRDGSLLPATAPSLALMASDLSPGTHTIKCVVIDTTYLVRVDPLQLLRDSVTWTVNASASCHCQCHGDPNCDGSFDIIDVVALIGITLRDAPPVVTGACPHADADLNCDGVVDLVDVVTAVGISFRNDDPRVNVCNPCQ